MGENHLEADVWGHGKMYRTWAVQQWDVTGAVDDPYGGAWETLYGQIMGMDGTWHDAEGRPFRLVIVGITGIGPDKVTGIPDVTCRFAERWSPLAYAVRKFALLLCHRGESGDIPGTPGFKKYRICKIGPGGEIIIEISGEFYRKTAEARLEIEAGRPGEVYLPDDFSAGSLCLHCALADVYLRTQADLIKERNGEDFTPGRVLDCMERMLAAYTGDTADRKEAPAWFRKAEKHAEFSVFLGPEDRAEISWGTLRGGLVNKTTLRGPCTILAITD
jgi:hypothetical protein